MPRWLSWPAVPRQPGQSAMPFTRILILWQFLVIGSLPRTAVWAAITVSVALGLKNSGSLMKGLRSVMTFVSIFPDLD